MHCVIGVIGQRSSSDARNGSKTNGGCPKRVPYDDPRPCLCVRRETLALAAVSNARAAHVAAVTGE